MEQPITRSAADPLDTPPPAFSLSDAEAIAKRIFGIDGSAAALDSERDQNFCIVAGGERSFLLKISNPADQRAAIEMQTQATLHVADQNPSLPVMQPLRSLEGDHLTEVEGANEATYLVRLFTFLPGRNLAATELDPDALIHFGAVIARMGLALRGFFHPAAGYKILWDLKHTPDLRPLLDEIHDPASRDVVATVLDRFDDRVRGVLPGLRAQVIHNDLTFDNLLFDDAHRVSGIVDFGDTTHTALINDLAISIASVMWGRSDPIDAANAAIAGYASVEPLEEVESDVLGDLVLTRLAASVLIANWRVTRYPDNAEYIMATESVAGELLKGFDAVGFPTFEAQLRAACLRPSLSKRRAAPPKDELLERRRRVLGPALSPLTYDEPLYLVRGEGVHMFDPDGNAYLDAYNNVPVVGHCHSKVTAAIAEQSATLNTNTRYLHDAVVELAERLTATMPEGLDTVMFVNSGSEANDIAWRLAVAHTGAAGGIVTTRAYHGVTTATLALSPEEWIEGERPAHVATIPPPDGFRGPYRAEESGWAERYAAHVDDAISGLEARNVLPAALFIDALLTSDGIFAPPPEYLQEVIRRVHEAGGLFVADEVQCGFGRDGTNLWSFQSSGIDPDFVTLGKPMGNGHPVAAVVMRSEIADMFAAKSDIFSTFGGNPVACRAALAVLDVIEEEGLVERARDVGRRLRADLEGLKERHAAIGNVRGAGLLLGVELISDRDAREPAPALTHAVMNAMKEHGVLVGVTGPNDNVLKIRP
ncbi:MAG: aminotransferase class III-fold pyridoxal phosphate-dependent enzyme, partial [Actinomycetota bacterium]